MQAKLISIKDGKALVQCPFFPHTHEHPRQSVGSKELVAGCSKGYAQFRTYELPKR